MATTLRVMLVFFVLFSAGHAVDAQETQTPPAATPQEEPRSNIRQAIHWKQLQYTCADGEKISVALSGSLAKVLFQGHQYLMKQTVSADGTRYSDEKVVWWGKGEGGFLQEDNPDGDGKMLAKDCRLVKPAEAGGIGVVTGSVSYMQRIALPPQATVEVKLQDASATGPRLIAEQKFAVGNQQVPMPFELKFDPKDIDPRHPYEVSARILLDGKVRFVSDTAYPVLTGSKPSHIEMMLRAPRP
jgi:putative lipoprotein